VKDSEEIGKPIALTIAQLVLGCTSAFFLVTVSVALLIAPFRFSTLMYGTLLGIVPALACILLYKRSPFSRYLAATALASQLSYIFRFYEVWFLGPNSTWGIQDVLQNATVASLFFGAGAIGLGLLSLIYVLLTNRSVKSYMSPPEVTVEKESDVLTPKFLFDGIDDHELINNSRKDSVKYV
jgi:hypothetical protein